MKQSLAYVTEPDEERIRTIATNGTTATFVDLPWSFYGFISPQGICYEPITNSFYVTDYHRILKVDAAGTVSIYAGYWQQGYIDHVSPGRARFNDPEGICTDNAGNLYVADKSNHCIRKISITTGQVTTLSGTGTVAGYMNGAGNTAKFNTPYGICFDAANSCLYVTDQFNNRIRKILMNGHTTPFAGSGLVGQDDGAQGIARFTNPRGITVDLNGAVLVVQGSGKPLRKIFSGEVTTVIPDNGLGYTDGDASVAQFYQPKYIAVNSANQYLITDWFNLVIRKVVCQ
jgi:DNA-binding beta-propeller fold protein YncE